MAAGTPTGTRIKRDPNYIYFVDAAGNVRKARRRTGGKAGRKSCWPRTSPKTGRKIAHPRFGTEGRSSYKHRSTGRRKTGGFFGSGRGMTKAGLREMQRRSSRH
jgi:hypothetical protein